MQCPFSDQKMQIVAIVGEGLSEAPHSIAWFHLGCCLEVMNGKHVLAIAQKALETYHTGGMETEQGKLRTMGGVFFRLFKDECSVEQLRRWYRLKRFGLSAWCAWKDQYYDEMKKREGNKARSKSINDKRSTRPEHSAQKTPGRSASKNIHLQKVATAL